MVKEDDVAEERCQSLMWTDVLKRSKVNAEIFQSSSTTVR